MSTDIAKKHQIRMSRRNFTNNNCISTIRVATTIATAITITSYVASSSAFVSLPSFQQARSGLSSSSSSRNNRCWASISSAFPKYTPITKSCTLQNKRILTTLFAIDNDDDNNDDPAENESSSSQQQEKETKGDILTKAAAYVTRSSIPSTLLGTKTIGVDYGLVRTGIAATVGYDPRPLTILSSLNETETASAIVSICRAEKAERVVLGLPLHKNGTEAEQSNLTRAFGTYLACACYAEFGPAVPVFLWDERYTSKEAAARARSRDPGAVDLYGELDADAACIILEHYYADGGMRRIGSGGDDGAEQLEAERVEVPEAMKDVVEAAWEAKREELEWEKEKMMEERTAMLNARKDAMERAKALEKQMEMNGTLGLGRKKAKKKKKKKKKKNGSSSGGEKWITL